MGKHQTHITPWVKQAQGARPAQLVAEQLAKALLGADVAEEEPRNCNPKSQPANGLPHRVVVGELVGESPKPTNTIEGLGSERNGRAKAWPGEPKLETHQDAG